MPTFKLLPVLLLVDSFLQNEVGILSPHNVAQGDGNIMTIPREDLPENYEALAFRIKQIKSDLEPLNPPSHD